MRQASAFLKEVLGNEKVQDAQLQARLLELNSMGLQAGQVDDIIIHKSIFDI